MTWEVDTTVGLTVGSGVPISLRAFRSEGAALLSIGRSDCEIRLERVHLQALRDQLPAVLAGLDRVAAAEAACAAAEVTGGRAAASAATALDRAGAAEVAGAGEMAQAARIAAARASAAADEVDARLRAVAEAALAADDAADHAGYAADQAAAAARG